MVMTAPYVPDAAPSATPAPDAFAPGSQKRPLSALSIVAFILAIVIAFCFMTVRIVAAAVSNVPPSSEDVLATVIGWLQLVSLIVIVGNVVIGHLALRKPTAHFRARLLGAIGLGIAYLFLALYFNRVIVALIATLTIKEGSDFVQNNFYWT
jgi:hypothetical protein